MRSGNIVVQVLACLCILHCASTRADSCDKVTATHIEFTQEDTPPIPRHDQAIGVTRIALTSRPSGNEITTLRYDGHWYCIGFDAKTHRYIVGGNFEQGAWLTLGSIQYLDEDGHIIPSAFDQSAHIAMTATSSPSSQFIAYIGGRGTVDALYVLDTRRNIVKRLARAPSPPPKPDATMAGMCGDEPFVWGSCWADGFETLDDGIVRFLSDTRLYVSYGKDTPLRRATRRHIHHFTLDK